MTDIPQGFEATDKSEARMLKYDPFNVGFKRVIGFVCKCCVVNFKSFVAFGDVQVSFSI